jgi:hypothetical protein
MDQTLVDALDVLARQEQRSPEAVVADLLTWDRVKGTGS